MRCLKLIPCALKLEHFQNSNRSLRATVILSFSWSSLWPFVTINTCNIYARNYRLNLFSNNFDQVVTGVIKGIVPRIKAFGLIFSDEEEKNFKAFLALIPHISKDFRHNPPPIHTQKHFKCVLCETFLKFNCWHSGESWGEYRVTCLLSMRSQLRATKETRTPSMLSLNSASLMKLNY